MYNVYVNTQFDVCINKLLFLDIWVIDRSKQFVHINQILYFFRLLSKPSSFVKLILIDCVAAARYFISCILVYPSNTAVK